MQNEFEPVAKRDTGGFVQYVCQLCGGYRTLVGASDKFLPFIDHLIRDLALLENPKLNNPRLVGDQIWYQLPETNEIIWGLPAYDPDSAEWKRLLENGQKILPQARLFLLDIADWLEKALSSLEQISSITTSDLFAARPESLGETASGPTDPGGRVGAGSCTGIGGPDGFGAWPLQGPG